MASSVSVKSPGKRKIDEEDEQKDNGQDKRPLCPYGSTCYRKNPAHIDEYQHNNANKISPSPDKVVGPPCKYGANCFRKNLLHFAEFWHPVQSEPVNSAASLGSDGVESSECNDCEQSGSASESDRETDLEQENEELTQDVNDSDDNRPSSLPQLTSILKRGPSLLKSYSLLTEEQRKELVKRALEVKDQLKKELEETLDIIKEKNREIEELCSKIDHGHLKVEGEQEAMEKDELVYFPLFPERAYKEGSAEQLHFRIAESQFYRLLDANSSLRVTKVEYVINPELVQRFYDARKHLKNTFGEDMSLPVLAFHGTAIKNISSICTTGFRTPGDQNFKHATDTGFYGCGVYFSEYPSYSMQYIKGASKILLCQVLPGKAYHCKNLIHGENLKKGYTRILHLMEKKWLSSTPFIFYRLILFIMELRKVTLSTKSKKSRKRIFYN